MWVLFRAQTGRRIAARCQGKRIFLCGELHISRPFARRSLERTELAEANWDWNDPSGIRFPADSILLCALCALERAALGPPLGRLGAGGRGDLMRLP